MQNFKDIYEQLQASEHFKSFDQGDYYLAHGFVQLNANGGVSKPWHIGFYSPSKDDLAIFTSPNFELAFDKAFKESGVIAKLPFDQNFVPTKEVYEKVLAKIREDYSEQIPFTYIIILQMVDQKPVYNITVVTQAFQMLTFHLDAQTAEFLKEKRSSVMDLKSNEA